MDGEAIFSTIIFAFVGLGCGALFYWIGVWAEKRKDPMHFYTGTVVDPETISDIPAYNRANARMWKRYSIPYWLCGICSILMPWMPDVVGTVALVSIILSCTIGIWWLVHTYHKIYRAYKI